MGNVVHPTGKALRRWRRADSVSQKTITLTSWSEVMRLEKVGILVARRKYKVKKIILHGSNDTKCLKSEKGGCLVVNIHACYEINTFYNIILHVDVSGINIFN